VGWVLDAIDTMKLKVKLCLCNMTVAEADESRARLCQTVLTAVATNVAVPTVVVGYY
jgi:hypothetical protein